MGKGRGKKGKAPAASDDESLSDGGSGDERQERKRKRAGADSDNDSEEVVILPDIKGISSKLVTGECLAKHCSIEDMKDTMKALDKTMGLVGAAIKCSTKKVLVDKAMSEALDPKGPVVLPDHPPPAAADLTLPPEAGLFHLLPPELLKRFLHLVEAKTLTKLGSTNKAWLKLARRPDVYCHMSTLAAKNMNTVLATLKQPRFRLLQRFDLPYCKAKVGSNTFSGLAKVLPALTHLRLTKDVKKPEDLGELSKFFTDLKGLSLSFYIYSSSNKDLWTKALITALVNNPRLEELQIQLSGRPLWDDDMIKQLCKGCPDLKKVNIFDGTGWNETDPKSSVTLEGAAHFLESLENLESLHLGRMPLVAKGRTMDGGGLTLHGIAAEVRPGCKVVIAGEKDPTLDPEKGDVITPGWIWPREHPGVMDAW